MGLRTAVIGAGVVSNTHLSVDAANPRTDLVAVCDLDADRARSAAAEFNIKPYTDVTELLESEDLDLVHVCTPVQSHLQLARIAIEAGVAAAIEKPIAESTDQVDELQALSDEHDVPVTVIHQMVFSPAMRKARRLIANGAVGSVRAVEFVNTGGTRPDEAKRGEWVFELPGGEFEEGIPHYIYPLLNVGGYPRSADDVRVVTSLVGEYGDEYRYDGAQVQYVTNTETLCSATMTAGGQVEKLLHVQGERGSLTVDMLTQVVTVSSGDFNSSLGKVRKNLGESLDRLTGTAANATAVLRHRFDDSWESEKRINAHAYQIDETVTALETGSAMPIPLEEGWWTIELMQRIRDESTRAPRQPSAVGD